MWTKERELQLLEAQEAILKKHLAILDAALKEFKEQSDALFRQVWLERSKLHNERAGELNWSRHGTNQLCDTCDAQFKKEES